MPTITVLSGDEFHKIDVEKGANLRLALLKAGYSPYTAITRSFNCGGRGLCATCGVWIVEAEPAPQHWHDQLASAFGYPRLSCQVSVDADMTIRLVEDKIIWGGRDGKRARRWMSSGQA